MERVGVAGTVTRSGQPLESGSGLLLPPTRRAPAGTQTEEGRSSVTRSDGPSPGNYRVEIRAFHDTGRMVTDNDLPGQMMEVRE